MRHMFCFNWKKVIFFVELLAIGLYAYSMDTTEILVQNEKREALIYIPKEIKTEYQPIIFVFHGHGGSMATAATKFHFESLWPEAVVVYPQGLPTPTLSDPEGKKSGWQRYIGDQEDRDLKLFDEIMIYLEEKYQITREALAKVSLF